MIHMQLALNQFVHIFRGFKITRWETLNMALPDRAFSASHDSLCLSIQKKKKKWAAPATSIIMINCPAAGV